MKHNTLLYLAFKRVLFSIMFFCHFFACLFADFKNYNFQVWESQQVWTASKMRSFSVPASKCPYAQNEIHIEILFPDY